MTANRGRDNPGLHHPDDAGSQSGPQYSILLIRQISAWLHHWDALDRRAGSAILVLAALLGYLVTTLDTTATATLGRAASLPAATAQAASPEYGAKLKTAEQFLATGNMDNLKPLLDALIAGYPFQSEPFMLLADYHIRRQEPVAAMRAYRRALDLNLDYLEKKTPLYQGKKIKNTVREAEGAITASLASSPDDPAMQENRKELYYMLRKLAGGCGD